MLENPQYLSQQLITYIGNKRSLLPLIQQGVDYVKSRLNQEKFSCLDIFSGSGIVSRFLKQYSHTLYANDLEPYSYIINQCYLANTLPDNLVDYYNNIQDKLENRPLKEGVISRLYAPKNDQNIQLGERTFYTTRNARFLDTARQYIAEIPENLQPFLLAPLLSQASVHANTSGVFKGFYKNKNGIGQLGGHAQNALQRITADIQLQLPILSSHQSIVHIFQKDANALARELPAVDIAYLDPPYNQHPYGSNYFMLNLLVNYQEPDQTSRVSGIPVNWNRSMYNKKQLAAQTLFDLCRTLKAKYLLISFSSEGFISKEEMEKDLGNIGKITTLEQKYPAFRASRNLKYREIHLKEYLYVVEK